MGFAAVCVLMGGGGGTAAFASLFLSFRLAGIVSVFPYALVPVYFPNVLHKTSSGPSQREGVRYELARQHDPVKIGV